MNIVDVPPLESVEPGALIQALGDAGWVTMGRSLSAVRLQSPPSVPLTWAVIPLSMDMPGARRMLQIALEEVAGVSNGGLRGVTDLMEIRATVGPRDSVRFRKETSAPRGLILWSHGQELIDAAKQTLVASAKAFAGTSAYYGNSHSGFAKRYLDACYMGQTGIGSYVVTALTPIEADLSPKSDKTAANHMNGREVTETLVKALSATVEAIEHFQRTESRSGFIDAVQRGLSVEMTRGLIGIAEKAEVSTISIEWDTYATSLLSDSEPAAFEFTAADIPALEAARTTLEQDPRVSARQRIQGRVHLLTKAEAGGPGVIGVDTGAGKYRVRLGPDDYGRAVQAHHDEALVTVEGLPEREGNLTWLYDSYFVGIDPSDPGGEGLQLF